MAGYQAIPKAKDLLDYTMQRTQTKTGETDKPHFPKSQTFYYCKADGNRAAVLRDEQRAAEIAQIAEIIKRIT